MFSPAKSPRPSHLLRLVALMAMMSLYGVKTDAQIVTTEGGDTIEVGKDFQLDSEQPIFVNNNGFISGCELTEEVLDTLKNVLFTSTDFSFDDYIIMATAFDTREDCWHLAYRCSLNALAYADYIHEAIDAAFSDEMIADLQTMNSITMKTLALHVEKDSAIICAQNDSVVASLRRMDALSDIYKGSEMEVMDHILAKQFLKPIITEIEKHKKRLHSLPEQYRIIRQFLDACAKNRKNVRATEKAALPFISWNLRNPGSFNRTDYYLPDDNWEGWDAFDQKRTFIMEYNESNNFLVVITPLSLDIDEKYVKPGTSPTPVKTFIVNVNMPTDSNHHWKVNEVRTIEEQEEWDKSFIDSGALKLLHGR